MIDSTLQSDRVVVPATQAENHLTHQKHFKNTKNDCYTGNRRQQRQRRRPRLFTETDNKAENQQVLKENFKF